MSAETYEIVVIGMLSPAFAGAFDDFAVVATEQGSSYLVGSVPDQARLHGALSMLRDLGIELVSVTRVNPPLDGPPAAGTKEES